MLEPVVTAASAPADDEAGREATRRHFEATRQASQPICASVPDTNATIATTRPSPGCSATPATSRLALTTRKTPTDSLMPRVLRACTSRPCR